MGKLLTVQRALDDSLDWVSTIRTACELSNVEYTRELGVTVSYLLKDKLIMGADLTVTWPEITDHEVIEAVKQCRPKYPDTWVANLMVNHDQAYIERVQLICLKEQYHYSSRLALAVAEAISRDAKTNVIVHGEHSVDTMGVADNKLQSAVNTQWNTKFKAEWEAEQEDGGGGE